jgi:hypothetical protein
VCFVAGVLALLVVVELGFLVDYRKIEKAWGAITDG